MCQYHSESSQWVRHLFFWCRFFAFRSLLDWGLYVWDDHFLSQAAFLQAPCCSRRSSQEGTTKLFVSPRAGSRFALSHSRSTLTESSSPLSASPSPPPASPLEAFLFGYLFPPPVALPSAENSVTFSAFVILHYFLSNFTLFCHSLSSPVAPRGSGFLALGSDCSGSGASESR